MTDVALEPLPRDVPQWQVWRYRPLCWLLPAMETKRLSLTLLKNYSKDDPYETSVPKSVDQADSQITNSGQTLDVANAIASGRFGTTGYHSGGSAVDPYEELKRRRRALGCVNNQVL